MQKDFHFYTIYALARSAGFDAGNAYIIAYSSQHTDDAKYEHALEFENGGRFQQVLTAHQFIDLDALGKATCYRIWMPFHFLPGNLGVDFYERMLTRANSIVAQRIVEDFLSSNLKPYSLHRLGITLHVYADTWSHQNFIGLVHENMNDIKTLRIEGETAKSFNALVKGLKRKILEYAAPKLGHAQAGTIPDEPYREWRYKDYKGKTVHSSNPERSLDAAQNCYMVLLQFLRRFPRFSLNPPLPWQEMVGQLNNLFALKRDLVDRIRAWQEHIADGRFGFAPEEGDAGLGYHDRQWFREAVKVIQEPDKPDRYERRAGFETSNWKYFHDAAAFHRFSALHEVLPDYGIICG
jgi:hypothetical protein